MWEMVKDTTESADIREFLELFPKGQLVGVAKFKLKKLERRSKPTKPIPQPKVLPVKKQLLK